MGTIDKTLEAVKNAVLASQQDVSKSATTGFRQDPGVIQGTNFFDLDPVLHTFVPFVTTLVDELPRVSKEGAAGIQANFRAIVDVDVNGAYAGVSEGNRGEVLATRTAEFFSPYRGIGLENSQTFENKYASDGYVDVKATAINNTLRMLRVEEDRMLLGGNTTMDLGTAGVCPTPTVANNATAGTVLAGSGTLSVKCVAIGFRASQKIAGWNSGNTGKSYVLGAIDPNDIALFTKTNADGTTDTVKGGVSKVSAAGTCTIDGSHTSATAYVTPVPGAFKYAWYWGTSGSEYLGAVTSVNSVAILADAATSIAVGANLASNNSRCDLDFDGLLTLALTSGSGAYIKALETGTLGTGTKLSSDSAGGIVQINELFQDRFELYRLHVDQLWVGPKMADDMSKVAISNGGAPLVRYNMDGANPGQVQAGLMIGSILNRFTQQLTQIKVHPNMPDGAILSRTKEFSVPYPLPNVAQMERVVMRKSYHAIEWPLKTRKWEYGVYADETLQHFFPPALGVIYNIAPQ
jgi:hypothetical protein